MKDIPMIGLVSGCKQGVRRFSRPACLLFALLIATTASAKTTVVPKWSRFEQTFKSSVRYSNPPQECELRVTFTSPHGETNTVLGFWDGGKIWRVRFSPDFPGHWTYRTECSDSANTRLNDQTGEFLCSSTIGQGPFEQHGPIQVARDHLHFQHADGSPFFWLADVAWNGPRLATSRDWINYTQTRGGQKFSAVEWAVAPGMDSRKHSAFSGTDKIAIDPEYFQQLDGKIDLMNRAGLLSVIAPVWGDEAKNLPNDQVALLIRYVAARWGAYDVAWLLPADENDSVHWQRIGRESFGRTPHAPVIVFPGSLATTFSGYRDEDWVDAFGFGLGQNMDDNSLRRLVAGPLVREWNKPLMRPIINVLPPLENGIDPQTQQHISADDVRTVAWWSTLLVPAAGTSYGAQDVADWNTKQQGNGQTWQSALFLPGAKQTTHLAEFFQSTDYSDLRPAWATVAVQPGRVSPTHYIAGAESEKKDLDLTYVPKDRTVELYLEALSPSPTIQWLNPRTGQTSSAVAVVGSRTCQLPTPDVGDWLLVMKGGK
jgi:hypothetical protein